MLIQHSLSPLMGVWKIDESWQDMLEAFSNKDIYSTGVAEIRSEGRKQEWLAVRLLLKQMLGFETCIEYKENGAPFLPESIYNISISHTKGYATVLLSENSAPGIDIEYRSGRAWKLREKYIGDDEMTMFSSPCSDGLPDCDTLATVCWCAKETAFKVLQQVEVDFIKHLHILPFTLSDKGRFLMKETKTLQQQEFYVNYQVAEDYIITWKE